MAINWENKTPLKILKIFGYDHEKYYPTLDSRNAAREKAIKRIEKYKKGIPDERKKQIMSFNDDELKRIEREKEYERQRRERIRLKLRTIQNNIENDTYGDDEYAIALYQYLIENNEIEDNMIEELKEKKEELEATLSGVKGLRDKVKDELTDLQNRLSQVDNDTVADRISQRIEQLQQVSDQYDSDYEETEENLEDVVNELNELSINGALYEPGYGWYGNSRSFETDYGDYSVINETHIDDAFRDYVTQLIDDIGVLGVNEWVRESCIDTDEIKKILYDDRVLMYREDYNYNEVDFLERYVDYFPYDSQDKITEYVENYQFEDYDIDDFVNDNEVDDVIEEMAQEFANETADDTTELQAMGFELDEYIDKDCLIEEIMRADDYGTMSSYDGTYDVQYVNDDIYYIFRTN